MGTECMSCVDGAAMGSFPLGTMGFSCPVQGSRCNTVAVAQTLQTAENPLTLWGSGPKPVPLSIINAPWGHCGTDPVHCAPCRIGVWSPRQHPVPPAPNMGGDGEGVLLRPPPTSSLSPWLPIHVHPIFPMFVFLQVCPHGPPIPMGLLSPPMGPYPCRSPSLCVPIPTRGHVPIIPHSHISPPPGVPYSPRVPGGHCPYSPLTSVLFCPHPHVPLPHLPIPPRMASLGTGGPQQITPPGESTKEAASPNPPLPRTPQDPPSSTALLQPSAPVFCVRCRP